MKSGSFKGTNCSGGLPLTRGFFVEKTLKCINYLIILLDIFPTIGRKAPAVWIKERALFRCPSHESLITNNIYDVQSNKLKFTVGAEASL